MPINRIFLETEMTKYGMQISICRINLETKESTDKLSVPLVAPFMDKFMEWWQEFKDGTNKDHLLIGRWYLDDVADISISEAMKLDRERLDRERIDAEKYDDEDAKREKK